MSRQKAWWTVTKLHVLSQSDSHCCLLWPGAVLDAGVQRCGGHSPCRCGLRCSQMELGLASALQEKMLKELGVQRGLLRDAGQRGIEQSANKARTLAWILFHLLLPAALPGRTVIPASQMSKWDPGGEFPGPQSQQARGRAAVCQDSDAKSQIPSSLFISSSSLPPPPYPRAASRAQAPGWPETLLWERVSSED